MEVPQGERRLYTSADASPLLSKYGQVVMQLARNLLSYALDDRTPRVDELAVQVDASVGTVQSALDYLQQVGAARFAARGRLGTFVRELHFPLLWKIGFNRPIIGALPLPYSRRFEGLATGVRQQFLTQPLDLDLRFMRGATRRMQALAAHEIDWALVSQFAAETAEAHGFVVTPLVSLGLATYLADHVLLLGRADAQGLANGMRVGIDSASLDHAYAVQTISRGFAVELVEIEYSQGLQLVHAGTIDATIWSREDVPVDLPQIAAIPLDFTSDLALSQLGEAALIINTGDRAVANVLRAALDWAGLRQIQTEIVECVRPPMY